jgi:signal transduction histidine kinase
MLDSGHPALQEILADCAALAESNANDLRSLAYDLHAPWLDHGGLLSGIQEYAHQFSARTGIATSFEASPGIPRLLPVKEIALYRVLQESLMNVHRHSGARQAWILISLSHNELHMTVRDDGRDTAGPSRGNGVGILSMHERMKAIGGTLDVCRTPEGVTARAILPLDDEGNREGDQ